MTSNLDRYKKDYQRLVDDGTKIRYSFFLKCQPEEAKEGFLNSLKGDEAQLQKFLDSLPDFDETYQTWYSECIALIRQLLPDRLADFVRLYEKPKGRRDIGFENYRIEDALQSLVITRGPKHIAGPESAYTHLAQQLAIVKSLERRFESSLYDIRQLVQADLLDDEIESARQLHKHKFLRAAGAVAGVVLEKHLRQVCENHSVTISKKNPTIADFNEGLKTMDVVDLPQWRFNQHLGDIRNLCDHGKTADPTSEQVKDLIDGVAKVTKTLY